MENGVKRSARGGGVFEKVFKSGPICKIPFHKGRSGWKLIPPAVAKIIENNGFMPACRQQAGHGATDVSRSPGNQCLHKKFALP